MPRLGVGVPLPGEAVVFPREGGEPHRNVRPAVLHRDEHLLPLLEAAPVVVGGVEDEERGGNPVDRLDGAGTALHPAHQRPVAAFEGAFEDAAHVAGAVGGRPVAEVPLADGGGEAGGVADDVVGHEAAVAAAGDAEAAPVDKAEADGGVQKGHQVVVGAAVPGAFFVFLPVAHRAPGVAPDDGHPPGRQVVELKPPVERVEALGAAVDVEDGGVGFPFFVPGGFQDPAVDLHLAVGGGDFQLGQLRQPHLVHPAV